MARLFLSCCRTNLTAGHGHLWHEYYWPTREPASPVPNRPSIKSAPRSQRPKLNIAQWIKCVIKCNKNYIIGVVWGCGDDPPQASSYEGSRSIHTYSLHLGEVYFCSTGLVNSETNPSLAHCTPQPHMN